MTRTYFVTYKHHQNWTILFCRLFFSALSSKLADWTRRNDDDENQTKASRFKREIYHHDERSEKRKRFRTFLWFWTKFRLDLNSGLTADRISGWSSGMLWKVGHRLFVDGIRIQFLVLCSICFWNKISLPFVLIFLKKCREFPKRFNRNLFSRTEFKFCSDDQHFLEFLLAKRCPTLAHWTINWHMLELYWNSKSITKVMYKLIYSFTIVKENCLIMPSRNRWSLQRQSRQIDAIS